MLLDTKELLSGIRQLVINENQIYKNSNKMYNLKKPDNFKNKCVKPHILRITQ